MKFLQVVENNLNKLFSIKNVKSRMISKVSETIVEIEYHSKTGEY